jgi:hypothetical protein
VIPDGSDKEAVLAYLEIESSQGETRDDQKLARLRDWLARPNWNAEEAWKVLAGIDPELSPNVEHRNWWLLPGTPPDVDDNEILDRLWRVSELGLKILRPAEAITCTVAAGILIPWLDVALKDPGCRILLPEGLEGSSEDTAASRVGSKDAENNKHREILDRQSDGARKAANARWDKDLGHQMTMEFGKSFFDSILATGFDGYRHENGRFARKIYKEEVFIEVMKAIREGAGKNRAGSVQKEDTVRAKVNEWIRLCGVR